MTTVAQSVTSKPGKGSGTGTAVEGAIDRTGGVATIIVRSAADRTRIVIAVALDCRMEPAPFR